MYFQPLVLRFVFLISFIFSSVFSDSQHTQVSESLKEQLITPTSSSMRLKTHLGKAEKGDYFVVVQGKCYTLFHIFEKQPTQLTIEEITVPAFIATQSIHSWKDWLASGAPQNTSWVLYQIDLHSGQLHNYYSFTKNGWFVVSEVDNFLQTLLNLNFYPIPDTLRRRIGRASSGSKGNGDLRPLWQPALVFNGQVMPKVPFDAFYAKWPSDGGFLSKKIIEIYIPTDPGPFPSFFPYWLQVKGGTGPAKVRIADAGKEAQSPKRGYPLIQKP